jgi:signal transduction histidine kinase
VGDPVRIGQILTNLIGNAVKFTEQGGVQVGIECLERAPADNQPDAMGIAIRVKDTGIGLAPDAASRSFEPFSQGDSSITRKYGGAGLGLAITRRLCELMGGNLRVDSRLGEGATFAAEISVRRAPDYLV